MREERIYDEKFDLLEKNQRQILHIRFPFTDLFPRSALSLSLSVYLMVFMEIPYPLDSLFRLIPSSFRHFPPE